MMTMLKLTSTVMVIAVLSSLIAAPARANDLERVLGALAVGYLAYEALDDARHLAPPPPPPPPPPMAYNPPPAGYHGGVPCHWYREGYNDAFRGRPVYAPPSPRVERGEALLWYRNGHEDGVRDARRYSGPPRPGVTVIIPGGPGHHDDRWREPGRPGPGHPGGRPGQYGPPRYDRRGDRGGAPGRGR